MKNIRAEKVKVLKSLRHFQSEDVKKNFVRGQYGEGYIDGKQVKAYRDEDRVADDSNTPTFVSGKLTLITLDGLAYHSIFVLVNV
ncbi:Glucose-6-phosphate 1-dehydrogenase [Staphylococcus aureus]|uniref:Glucose-6-phosphate 1-dehydrogenase n=1 Tax=Staphylococcus aureus TaxID=1280 RepID=A0A380E3X1_STAAU|nr:Glucose-6-phosphate 1-dehydrogenase [Staphylococcus aureus]